jgi:heme/copper-type cytochrome/quinol oxidase subunit 1
LVKPVGFAYPPLSGIQFSPAWALTITFGAAAAGVARFAGINLLVTITKMRALAWAAG